MDGSVPIMNDLERLCIARNWADESYVWLADALNRDQVSAREPDMAEQLSALGDGLLAFSDALHAVTMSYPKPSKPTPPGKHLKLA